MKCQLNQEAGIMLDLVYLALSIGFFLLMAAYARFASQG